MNFTKARKKKGIASLEVTPLVDVVFLLLIFFLLTATYVKHPNIDIKLPKASSQDVFNKTKDFAIAIKKNGDIKVENKIVSISQLKTSFKNKLAKDGPDTVVIINADKGALHGRVVQVMDLAKKNGFSKLAIAVDAPVSDEDENKK
jgi:biopolymer transport protein ExbD